MSETSRWDEMGHVLCCVSSVATSAAVPHRTVVTLCPITQHAAEGSQVAELHQVALSAQAHQKAGVQQLGTHIGDRVRHLLLRLGRLAL